MTCGFRMNSNRRLHIPPHQWASTVKQKRELDMWKKTILMAVIGTALSFGTIASASADTVWQKNHPRREEVNNRLNNQNRRINQERAEGEISANQARTMHNEDRMVRTSGALRCPLQRWAHHESGTARAEPGRKRSKPPDWPVNREGSYAHVERVTARPLEPHAAHVAG